MKMKVTLATADDLLFTGGVLIPLLVPRTLRADATEVNDSGSELPRQAEATERGAADPGRDPEGRLSKSSGPGPPSEPCRFCVDLALEGLLGYLNG